MSSIACQRATGYNASMQDDSYDAETDDQLSKAALVTLAVVLAGLWCVLLYVLYEALK